MMGRVIRWCAAIIWAVMASAPAARGADAASSEMSALAVIDREGGAARVVVLSGIAPPTLAILHELGERPLAWSTNGNELVMVFAAPAGEAGTARVHPVRRVRLERDAWDVVVPGSLEALPPMAPFTGRAALTIADGVVHALVGIETDEKKLIRLGEVSWEAVGPEAVVRGQAWDGLMSLGATAALTWSDGGEVRIAPIRSDGEAGDVIRASTPGPMGLVSVGGQIVGVSTPTALAGAAYTGEAIAWMIRPGALVEFSRIEGVASGASAMAYGREALALISVDETRRGLNAVIVGLDGRERFRGAVQIATVWGSAELQVLLLMLASAALTVALYVLRPDRVASTPTKFPTGMALASPFARVLAGSIDASMAIILVALVWPGDVNLMTAPLHAVVTKLGIWPLVAALGVAALHMGIAEAAIGTTMGKAIVGCRTVDRRGERIGVGVSMARSAAKAVCPMLALFVLANPGLPHPGAFGTHVVLRRGEAEAKDGAGS